MEFHVKFRIEELRGQGAYKCNFCYLEKYARWKFRNYTDPYGRKKVQIDFLMLSNWNLEANFSQSMH